MLIYFHVGILNPVGFIYFSRGDPYSQNFYIFSKVIPKCKRIDIISGGIPRS